MSGASTATIEVVEMAQGAWNEAVRRARIGKEIKLALLVVGSYANADGTGVYCGVARLAADCEVTYRSASRYLSWMRATGFLTLVKRGNRRRGLADVYRLTLACDVAERVTLPSPDEYRAIVGEIASANRVTANARQRAARERKQANDASTDTHDDRSSANDQEVDLRPQGDRRTGGSDDGSTDTGASVDGPFYGHESARSTDTNGVLPPSMDHLTERTNLPWQQPDLRSSRQGVARASASNADFDHGRDEARAYLLTLGELGSALMAQARAELGNDADRSTVIERAAELARALKAS